MGFHTKRSPSRSKQFLTCVGSMALSSAVPPELRQVAGDAARLGTAVHALNEHVLKHGKQSADLRDRIILIIENEENEGASILKPGAKLPKARADNYVFIVDDDMIENSEILVDYVRERCREFGVDEKALQLETRTNPLPERDDTSGTADITMDAWPELLEVIDYKNGFLIVDHEDNSQAKAYLLGKAIETDFSHELYRTTIVQPRSLHPEGPIRFEEFSADALREFQKEYRAGIKKNETAEKAFTDPPTAAWEKKYLVPGDHCTFCDAGATCNARRRSVEDEAKMDFADEPRELEIMKPALDGEILPPDGDQTAERVARILRWAPYLDGLVKAAHLYAHRALEAGYEIPGFKLVPRRSNREFIKGAARQIAADIVAKGYVDDIKKLYTSPKLISGPQAEKLVPSKKRKQFAADFLVKPDNGTTIAPIESPLPQVPPSIETDFEEFEAQEDFEAADDFEVINSAEDDDDEFDFG